MINKQKAIEIVIEEISKTLTIPIRIGVIENEVVEFDAGFFIRYNAKDAIINPGSPLGLTGIFPVIVEKGTGKLIEPGFDGHPNLIINWYYNKLSDNRYR